MAADLADRMLSETRNGTPVTYAYDATDQLTGDGSNTYGYDLAGNRNTTGYSTDTGNRLTADGTHTYQYDDEGNRTRKTANSDGSYWSYEYDHANQLTAARKYTSGGTLLAEVAYKYDAWGNRVERAEDPDGAGAGGVTTERYGLDGWKVQQDFWGNTAGFAGNENFDAWADLDGSNALVTRRLYGDGVDEPVARVNAAGATAWYHQDVRGSVTALTDASGTVQTQYAYDGFGTATLTGSAASGDRYQYTAREYDAATDQYHYRERWYDARTGTFTTEDPIEFESGDYNLRRYVGNQVTNFTDPSGLLEDETTCDTPEKDRRSYMYDFWIFGHNLAVFRNRLINNRSFLIGAGLASDAQAWDRVSKRVFGPAALTEEQLEIVDGMRSTLLSIMEKVNDRNTSESSRQELLMLFRSLSISFATAIDALLEGRKDDWNANIAESDALIRLQNAREVEDRIKQIQLALDAIGVFEPVPVADGLNTFLHFIQGNYQEAGISLLGVFFIGDAFKGRRCGPAFEELADMTLKGWSTGKGAPHLEKHLAKFAFKTVAEYTNAAKAFAKEYGQKMIVAKVGNTYFKFDQATGRILIVNGRGRRIKTFYRADDGINTFFVAIRNHAAHLVSQGHGGAGIEITFGWAIDRISPR